MYYKQNTENIQNVAKWLSHTTSEPSDRLCHRHLWVNYEIYPDRFDKSLSGGLRILENGVSPFVAGRALWICLNIGDCEINPFI